MKDLSILEKVREKKKLLGNFADITIVVNIVWVFNIVDLALKYR